MDETQIINTINKVSFFSRLPRWLRIILIVLSIVTIIYWLIWLFIKTWNLLGKCLNWISRKEHWWLYSSCIILLIIGGLVIAQAFSDTKPFTILANNIKSLIDNIREMLGNNIKG